MKMHFSPIEEVLEFLTPEPQKPRRSEQDQDIDTEIDTETSADIDDDTSGNDISSSPAKLENILTVPNMPDSNDDNARSNNENIINVACRAGKVSKGLNNHVCGGKSVLKNNSNRKRHKKNIVPAVKCTKQEENDGSNVASTSSSKDLSLSCVNSSGSSETNYRLASIQVRITG